VLVDTRPAEIEHRFLVDGAEARTFLDRIAEHVPPEVHDPARPVEYVRTTYFDSDDLQLFRTQLRSGRRRVRVREYAAATDAEPIPLLSGVVAFELKESTGQTRRKQRMSAEPEQIAELLAGPTELRIQSAPLRRAAEAIRSGRLRPRLTTFFRRVSHAAGGIRVTLDEQINFARPVAIGRVGDPAEPADIVGRGPQLILEVKRRGEPPDWLASAMRELLLMTQFSKFRDGLLAAQRAEALRPAATSVQAAVTAAPSAFDRDPAFL
jgi:hypothetical protein